MYSISTIWLFILILLTTTSAYNQLRLVKQWSDIEYVFPNETIKLNAMFNKEYIPGTALPIDVDVYYGIGKQYALIFITLPRVQSGIPVTLGIVNPDNSVSPYPDYNWHMNPGHNCDGLTSVYRVKVDSRCNRLWVMDTGKIGTNEARNQRCLPQLLAFDLTTDRLIYRHRLRTGMFWGKSIFVTPLVDIRETCDDTFVYIADVGYGIIVVDINNDASWRVEDNLFYPNPHDGTFTIDGLSFNLMDGILGMALSPLVEIPLLNRYDRVLYFHPLASTVEGWLYTSSLRNRSAFDNNTMAAIGAVKAFTNKRHSQSAAEAIDNNGIMYFGIMNPPSILCWNIYTDFTSKNFHVISEDMEALQFASGVKVVDNLKGEQELWILTNSFQRFMTNTMSNKRLNFRIHGEKIQNILKNTPCLNNLNDNNFNRDIGFSRIGKPDISAP